MNFPSFSHVFWIDASSVVTIQHSLKGICDLPDAQSYTLDGSPESALRWIVSLKDNYVLVLDNLDVLLSEADLAKYLPPELRGNILITSCNHTLEHLTSPIDSFEVKPMEVNDAIELLLKAGGLDPFGMDLQAEVSIIVKELSCLPLAIVLAGVSISSGVALLETTLGNILITTEH